MEALLAAVCAADSSVAEATSRTPAASQFSIMGKNLEHAGVREGIETGGPGQNRTGDPSFRKRIFFLPELRRRCVYTSCTHLGGLDGPTIASLSYHFKPENGSSRPRLRLFYPAASCGGKSVFLAPAPRTALDHVAVVQHAFEDGADRGRIAQQFAQSSAGRFEVSMVLARSWRRMMISSSSSAALRCVRGHLPSPGV